MDLTSETEAHQSGLRYGRRKQIPYFLLAAASAAYFFVATSSATVRIFEASLLGWIGWRVYRCWSRPMTSGYAKAEARRRRLRSTKVPPKVAIGVVAAVLAYFAVFLAILLTNH
jgi:polyferredoxin